MQRPFAIWLIVEGRLIGFEWAIQYITAVDGFLIMLLVLMQSVRKFYADVS
jgi:low affinity Fe/Cu permease